MALPVPNLDDRDFQMLVDDAKRFVQQRCPTWTDHNVSDPGVTLIEAFAWMTDVLLYRLNRVPDRNYAKFLELIGVRLYPPTAAQVDVHFRLSTPQDKTISIPAGTSVSTARTVTEQAIPFSVTETLDIVAASVLTVGSIVAEGQLRDHTTGMNMGAAFTPFQDVPVAGDALYLGLDRPAPSNSVLIDVDCEIGGHGIDPDFPPIEWEAWTGERWERCEVLADATGGFNLSGHVELHLPKEQTLSAIDGHSAAWIRARITDEHDLPAYDASPRLLGVTGATIGGSARAAHADIITDEILGQSEGIAAQRFQLQRTPVIPTSESVALEVRPQVLDEGELDDEEDWETWELQTDFADSGPDDQHFTLDYTTGSIEFGPAVRMPDGTVRSYGAVPPKGATLRVRNYRTGGGAGGNIATGAISVLRSSIPFVASVTNRRPAAGGIDPENIDEAKVRGPIMLRTRNRAVTLEDYAELTREAAPELARVHCVPGEGDDVGLIRVLIVPWVPTSGGPIRLQDLNPDQATGERVTAHLDDRRVVGTRVVVEPPSYLPVTIAASVGARDDADPERAREATLAALYDYFNPITGGPDGNGWPFGRPVRRSEVYGVLQGVQGVDSIENVELFVSNPVSGERAAPDTPDLIPTGPTNLVMSFEHDVQVTA